MLSHIYLVIYQRNTNHKIVRSVMTIQDLIASFKCHKDEFGGKGGL